MKIFIYADLLKKSGYGHFVRSFSLSEELNKKYKDISFVIKKPQKEIYQFLKNNKINTINYNKFLNTSKSKSVIIIDSYLEGKKFIKKFKSQNLIVVFSDLKQQTYGDIIIRSNCNPKYKNKHDKATYLCGEKYKIIRSQLLKLKKIKKKSDIKKIYISFGGYEKNEIIINFFKSFLCSSINFKNKINLILNLNLYRDKIKKIFKNEKKFKLIFQDNKLLNKFNFDEVDMSINPGGVTSLEMIYLKIPQVCLQITANQKNNLKLVKDKNFGITLQFDQNKQKNNFKSTFAKFNTNYKNYQKNLNSQKLIDGFGAKRLVECIKREYAKKFK